MTFHPRHARSHADAGPHRVGWKQASTITGFCSAHDGPVFSTLETSEFVVSEEQCFLHTYRTICHELYAKMGALRAVPVTREHSDRGLSVHEQREFQQHAHWLEMGIHRGLANQRRFKGILDQALLSGDRACIETVAVEFAGDLCVATCGGFSPNIDLQGNQLQALHDLDRPMVEGLSLSSDVSSEGVAVVFGWLRGERAPSTFVDGVTCRQRRN